MSVTIACMTGGAAYRLVESGRLRARELPRRQTPFGVSQPILLVEDGPSPFYVMPRHGPAVADRIPPSRINYRANLYALKDLGVGGVLSWSAAGAIRHTLPLGHIVIPGDVIDLTHQRPTTFHERSGLGCLRQFPVFCPALAGALAEVLAEMSLPFQAGGTAAAVEGPRLETPAEVRRLGFLGADLVTYSLAPDFFLARELQMCLAGACCLTNYAEMGRQQRPFSSGALFAGLAEASPGEQLDRAVDSLPEMLHRLAGRMAPAGKTCQCDQTIAEHVAAGRIDPDWRTWFAGGGGA